MKSAISMFLCLILLSSFVIAREDTRTYYSDIETPAVWINPQKINVYIKEDKLKGFILEKSFKTWDEALKSKLNFRYVNSPENADITIEYIDKLNGNTAGITYPQYTNIQGKTYLIKAKILISKTSPIGFKFTDVQLNKITLHEIGHAIGILGHSESPSDIMYYATTDKTSLSSKDIETVEKIYRF